MKKRYSNFMDMHNSTKCNKPIELINLNKEIEEHIERESEKYERRSAEIWRDIERMKSCLK